MRRTGCIGPGQRLAPKPDESILQEVMGAKPAMHQCLVGSKTDNFTGFERYFEFSLHFYLTTCYTGQTDLPSIDNVKLGEN